MVSLQTYRIQTKQLGPVPGGTHIRGYILGHSRRPTDDGITTHPHELVDGHQSSNDGKIFHFNMSGQGGGVGHDDLVSYPAIVGDMGISHDKVALAQNGFSPSFRRGPVNGYEFPNHIVIADDYPGWLASVAQVLRGRADGNKGKQVAPFPNFAPPLDDHMGFDDRIVSDSHIFTD
jgi:hypothetical protein